jgi:hypothetical protein
MRLTRKTVNIYLHIAPVGLLLGFCRSLTSRKAAQIGVPDEFELIHGKD